MNRHLSITWVSFVSPIIDVYKKNSVRRQLVFISQPPLPPFFLSFSFDVVVVLFCSFACTGCTIEKLRLYKSGLRLQDNKIL